MLSGSCLEVQSQCLWVQCSVSSISGAGVHAAVAAPWDSTSADVLAPV